MGLEVVVVKRPSFEDQLGCLLTLETPHNLRALAYRSLESLGQVVGCLTLDAPKNVFGICPVDLL